MLGMGAVPAWAPSGETHLLETSGEVIKSVNYAADNMSYTASSNNGVEIVKVKNAPVGVILGGQTLN